MMRKMLIGLGVFILIFVLFYFSMWFFLGQILAKIVNNYIEILIPSIERNDISGFVSSLNVAYDNIVKELEKSPKNRLYKSIKSILSSYKYDFYNIESLTEEYMKIKQLELLKELINLGLSRAEYSQKTVPLGIMKSILVDFVKVYDKNLSLIKNTTNKEVFESLQKNYINYKYLLEGKEKFLTKLLNSNNIEYQTIACVEINNKRIKKLLPDVLKVFKSSTNEELKLSSVYALLRLGYFDESVSSFISYKLQEYFDTENENIYDFLETIGASKNAKYIKVLSSFTNTDNIPMKENILNAISRLKTE